MKEVRIPNRPLENVWKDINSPSPIANLERFQCQRLFFSLSLSLFLLLLLLFLYFIEFSPALKRFSESFVRSYLEWCLLEVISNGKVYISNGKVSSKKKLHVYWLLRACLRLHTTIHFFFHLIQKQHTSHATTTTQKKTSLLSNYVSESYVSTW